MVPVWDVQMRDVDMVAMRYMNVRFVLVVDMR